ncbi:MAG TPA: efflux RND transporter periplasmic adaptor subunit [Stellaceae bacterium]|nr:efflux RND transporter periplasmic adaptor subunit [Stellaceae bacterium]
MRRAFVALAAMLLTGSAMTAAAQTTASPSVLVQLAKLQKGSLPRRITTFGTVETSPAARQTVMAPVAAGVEAVYVKAGERVGAKAPLVRLGPSPATAAAYTQALSALRAGRDLVERTRSLLGQHLATAQQLTDAEKSAADARASLAALKAEGAGSPQTLRAASEAIVTAVSTSPGAIVAQGAALIDLALPNGLVLRAGVVPNQAPAINPGDAVRITPLGSTDAVAGRVLLRGSVVDPQTGLVPVDITLPPDGFMPGQMAQAGIVIGQVAGFVVPHEAILADDRGAPYVVQAIKGTAHKVAVKLLLSAGQQDVVAGALDPTAPLVLAGNYQLRDGMKVRVADPNGPGNK